MSLAKPFQPKQKAPTSIETRDWIKSSGLTNGGLHGAEVTMMLSYVTFARLFDLYTFRLWAVQSDKSNHLTTSLLALIVAALTLISILEMTYSYGFRATATTISAVIATPFRHS